MILRHQSLGTDLTEHCSSLMIGTAHLKTSSDQPEGLWRRLAARFGKPNFRTLLEQELTRAIVLCSLLIEIAARKISKIPQQSFLVWGKRRSRFLVDNAKCPEFMPSGAD